MGIGRVDVLICTKDSANIRPRLMSALGSAPWVNSIITETSKPLSTARVVGAKKCSTEWIAMFDDDVEIPPNWFGIMSKAAADGVLCVSSHFEEAYKPVSNYHKVAALLYPYPHKINSPRICNVLVRRSILANYRPPPCFFCEDILFHNYAKSIGEWITLPAFGVVHYLSKKDYRASGCAYYGSHIWGWAGFLRRMVSRLALSWYACLYSRDLSPVRYWYRFCIDFSSGWVAAWARGE